MLQWGGNKKVPVKNYVPCWDKECNTLCCSFLQAASSLLSQPEQKRHEWWEEAVNSIKFSDSSRKAWSTINKLTGRSGCSSHLCHVSTNLIASQLVKNRAHKTRSRKSTRLTNKELSNQWKVPPEGNSISGPFKPEELLLALGARKVSRSGFYFPRVHTPCWAGSQILVLWFPHFLHAPTQNPQDSEKSTNNSDL